MLKDGFSMDGDDATVDEITQLECYRTSNGVVISTVRAAQILYQ